MSSGRTVRCRWCKQVVNDDKRRFYCSDSCASSWAHYCSSARDSDDQFLEWVTAHLRVMAVTAAQEGDAELLIKISRELRQLRPAAAARQSDEMDQAHKDLLDAFG